MHKTGQGDAAFDYTRLGADGVPLAIQNGIYSETGNEADGTHWSCVRDNPSQVPGAGPWRVPQIKELMSLADFSCLNPARNTHGFPVTGDEPGGELAVMSATLVPNAGVLGFLFFHNSAVREQPAGGGANEGSAMRMLVRLVRSSGSR